MRVLALQVSLLSIPKEAPGQGLARDLLFQEFVGNPNGPVAWTVTPNQEGSNQNFVSIKTAVSEDNCSHQTRRGRHEEPPFLCGSAVPLRRVCNSPRGAYFPPHIAHVSRRFR